LLGAGELLALEALSYPLTRSLAEGAGVRTVGIELDSCGVIPDAVKAAFERAAFKALYVQPTLHNPLGVTMPEERRRELALKVAAGVSVGLIAAPQHLRDRIALALRANCWLPRGWHWKFPRGACARARSII